MANSASDVITQINKTEEHLKLFQAGKQVFLKQFLKRKFGVYFPPISLRKHCCLTLAGFQ